MIVTFYSFKGGVGRTTSLVQTAVQLALNGRSVVVWDLDLEAPGMQKLPDLAEIDRSVETGTLDCLERLLRDNYAFPEKLLRDSIRPFRSEAIDKAGGRLDFLLPARMDATGEDYAARFGAIDWGKLFRSNRSPGPAFFHRVAHALDQAGYEFILIDSRTGFTDLGAICTLQLPDLVVLVFNLNAQNLAGSARVHAAVTDKKVPVYLLANMIPADSSGTVDARLQDAKDQGLTLYPDRLVPLEARRLLSEEIPALHGATEGPDALAPLVDAILARKLDQEAATTAELREKTARFGPAADPVHKREIVARAKSFEEKVAELFELQGYQAVVDYKRDDMQFDIRLAHESRLVPDYVLVECKDTDRAVSQELVRAFAQKVAYARTVDRRPYKALLVARQRFANNAHAVAETEQVQLLGYADLVRRLVDLGPGIDRAIRDFEGTALERLYVEPDVVLQGDLEPGRAVTFRPLLSTVRQWLDKRGQQVLLLLGDFGTGKTSFCHRLAHDLAIAAKEDRAARRAPVFIDLKEAGSSTVTLENLVASHLQRLSPAPLHPNAILRMSSEGHLVLIFDGLDEALGYADPSRLAEMLRQILRAAEGDAKIVLTCRTHYFRDLPEVVKTAGSVPKVLSTEGATQLYEEIRERPGVEIGYLREFTSPQIDAYLAKAILPPADWRAARASIDSVYNLSDLAARPFLLELIVRTLPRLLDQSAGKPIGVADLYEAYCADWFQQNDFRLRLTREHKEALVEYLARLVWDAPDTRVHYQVLFEKVAGYFRDEPWTYQDKERADYEVRTALFLNRNPEGYYSFIHRSFLEFFVARSLRKGLRQRDAEILDLRLLSREISFFLEFWPEAGELPGLAEQVLLAPYRKRVSENALLLLYHHAVARLGPLLAPLRAEPLAADVHEQFGAIAPRSRPLRLAGADFSGLSLRGIDLHGADLAGASFSGTTLSGATLSGANLAGANLAFSALAGATLDDADLTVASLSHADARGARLRRARLTACDGSFAQLVGADLTGAELAGADLQGAGLLRAKLPVTVGPLELPDTSGRPRPEELALMPQVGHSSSVETIAWSPQGTVLASGSSDGTVRLWDAATGRLLRALEGHGGAVRSVAWSPDGRQLASGSDDGTVRLWDAATGRLLRTLEGHGGAVRSVAWSPDGRQLASGSSDRTVRLWDAATSGLLRTLEGHQDWVRSVAWSPDGRQLASGSDDGTVRLWDAATGRLLRTLEGHGGWVLSVAWSPDGRQLASGSSDRTVRLWDAATGRLLRTLEGDGGWVTSVAWSPDGRQLASGSSRLIVRLWDAATGRLLRTLEGHQDWVTSVAWSPDGRQFASGSDDHTVRLWDAATGRLLRTLEGHGGAVGSLAWSPDGRQLASGSSDWTVRLWDAATGRLLRTLEGHGDAVRSVAWSPDGRQVASGSDEHTVRLWDAATGRLLRTLEGHGDAVLSLAWSPDGRQLASGSDDGTVRLWDAATGRPQHVLAGAGAAGTLAWHPTGARLATGTAAGGIAIWELAPDAAPRRLASLLPLSDGAWCAYTDDGHVTGDPAGLEYIRFADGWALYDVADLPERVSSERVAAALRGTSLAKPAPSRKRGRRVSSGDG